jgi:eukaryotic-like serine/threonine-protein kinase
VSTETEIVERRVGTTLRGKWRLERLLGVGGMAAVYVAVHKIGRRDAIKILHPEIAASKELAARFEQEAHAVNRFHHPGAVEILDIDVTEDGAPFLVMELLAGESIETRIARQLLGVEDTLRIADELLDVLAAAHATGIVHRDIKPDNLFLLNDGRLKVLDFGIARMRQGAPNAVHTRVGVTIGTLSYMPPEQVAGKEIDPRTDLFAVGCTLFRMLTGRSPHEGDTELELMVKMATEPAPALGQVAPSMPADLCMVIDRSLAFDRDRRYPDAATMQRDVRALREEKPPPYASERLAAGDLPNPMKPPKAPVTAIIAPAGPPFAVAAGALPTSMPIPRSMMMPAMEGSKGRPTPPTFVHDDADADLMGPPPAVLSQVGSEGSKKEKVIAIAAVFATLLVLGIVAAIWWNHANSADDLAQGASPSPRAPPSASANNQGADPGPSVVPTSSSNQPTGKGKGWRRVN